MADRVDFYFRQRVAEAELDLALLKKADRDLAADLNIYGIVPGAVPAPHSPVPDLTADLTAPARAYGGVAAGARPGPTLDGFWRNYSEILSRLPVAAGSPFSLLRLLAAEPSDPSAVFKYSRWQALG